MKNLQQIFNEYGTDKGSKHKYHEVYEPLFKPNRDKEINFLEIGIWKGHSLQALRKYFPMATLYGIDIFSRILPKDVPVLNYPNVNWAKGDSTVSEIHRVLANRFGVEYDYILDDGRHDPEANMLTFQNCSPFLKKGGLYIIEDVWPLERMNNDQLSHPWLVKNQGRYSHLINEKFLSVLDRSGMKIERFDNRTKSGYPDSYVITLRKE